MKNSPKAKQSFFNLRLTKYPWMKFKRIIFFSKSYFEKSFYVLAYNFIINLVKLMQ